MSEEIVEESFRPATQRVDDSSKESVDALKSSVEKAKAAALTKVSGQ